MIFFLLASYVFAAEEFIYKGEATIRNGIYDTLEGSELVVRISAAEISFCGQNLFSRNRVGKIERKWERWGKYLHSGKNREGVYESDRLEVLRNYRSTNGPETQRIVLIQRGDTFTYAFKDSQVGGFEVEGKRELAPSPELKRLCFQ